MLKIKTVTLTLTVVFLMTIAMSASGQKASRAEIKQIDEYTRSIDKITKGRQEPDLIFADTAQDEEKPKWQRFSSTKDLDKFRETTETYTVAYNWRAKRKIVASNFTLFSASGDWAKYIDHYFRSDGSLSKVRSELRTFYGDYIVIEDIYFNSRGRLLKRTVKYLDLTTKKPKKPTSDFFSDNTTASEADYFKRTDLLPFAKLLITK